MEIAVIHFIILGVISGLTKGAGVLPDGPLNKTVGETVMFTTTLNPPEIPFVSVNWKFGGKNIITYSGLNNTAPEYEGRITLFMSTGSLELRNLTLNDSGVYSVTITPFGGTLQDGNTTLDVYERVANVVVTSNTTDLLEFNSSVSLSCSSSGLFLSFLWLNSSSEVTESNRVQLSDGGSTLTIVSVTRYDQGPFRCHVFNPVSNGTSDPVNLTINYGPENINLIISPSQEHYVEGSDISLMCSAVSRPSAHFMWLLNGDLLSDTGPELRLMNIQISQSGNYSCRAFNSKTMRYEKTQPSIVSVLERISGASITSSTYLTIEGNSVNLTCDAAGSVFTRKWMKGGSDLILAVNMALHDNNRVLSFSSLNKQDDGEYSCNVSNHLSNDEASFSMVVYYGPDNVQIRGPNELHLEETLTLTCSVETVPAIYIWMLNGTEIHYSAIYTKNNTEPSDSGNYICVVMNYLTWRISAAVHELTVTGFISDWSFGGLSAGAIAGIVIACLVVLSAIAVAVYYIYKQKIDNKAPPQSDNKEVEECVYENMSTYENTSTHENTTYANI